MAMRLAVCDDDVSILNTFRDIFQAPEYSSRVEFSMYSSADELLSACGSASFDLIFSDIMLGEANGIETAAQVCSRHPETKVVFITANLLQYAEEIFTDMQPYGYIGKPIYAPKVDYYISRLEKELARADLRLTVSTHGTEYELLLSDIRYLESDKRQVHIHCARETVSIYDRLDNLMQKLDSRFVRCHQSFAVNLEWVSRLDSNCFTVSGGSESEEDRLISISRNHLSESRKSYFEYKGRSVV